MSKSAHAEKNLRRVYASLSIRLPGQDRVKIELMPAPDFGGPAGLFRLRIARRYLQDPNGKVLFFDRDGIAKLAVDLALRGLSVLELTCPELPAGSRVSVRLASQKGWIYEGGYTLTPPFLSASGCWKVCILLKKGRIWINIDDVIYDYKDR